MQVGGFTAQGAAASIIKGVPTSARIPNGAIIEREVPFKLAGLKRVRLSLRNPDFTTARRVSRAVNALVAYPPRVTDPATVEVVVPDNYKNQVVDLLTDIEQLLVEPDQIAKIVIDEQSGIIVTVAYMYRRDRARQFDYRITETPSFAACAFLKRRHN